MANYFFAWAGIWNNEQYSVPRQPKCNNYGEQWEKFLYWELEKNKYQVFFVKDRVYKGEVKIYYCPTQMMLVDYFTKPLKGNMLKIFRYVIMGY